MILSKGHNLTTHLTNSLLCSMLFTTFTRTRFTHNSPALSMDLTSCFYSTLKGGDTSWWSNLQLFSDSRTLPKLIYAPPTLITESPPPSPSTSQTIVAEAPVVVALLIQSRWSTDSIFSSPLFLFFVSSLWSLSRSRCCTQQTIIAQCCCSYWSLAPSTSNRPPTHKNLPVNDVDLCVHLYAGGYAGRGTFNNKDTEHFKCITGCTIHSPLRPYPIAVLARSYITKQTHNQGRKGYSGYILSVKLSVFAVDWHYADVAGMNSTSLLPLFNPISTVTFDRLRSVRHSR